MILKFVEWVSVMEGVAGVEYSKSYGYNIIPSEVASIENADIAEIWDMIEEYCRVNTRTMGNPIAINAKEPNRIKIQRWLNSSEFRGFSELRGMKFVGDRGKYKSISVSFGEGSRGGRGSKSKGFSFEENLMNDLNMFSDSRSFDSHFSYPELAKTIIDRFDLYEKAFTVLDSSKADTSRPLVFKPNPEIENINSGSKIADLTINSEGTSIYLSLKFGPVVSLMNIGIKKYFKDSEIREGNIKNENALRFLQAFSIDKDLFCRVFNEYGKTNFLEYHKEIKASKELEALIESGFGNGYWVVHQKNKTSDIYEVSKSFAKESSRIIGNVKIQYGGRDGKSKRVGLSFETKNFSFFLLIRNTAGGIYPSHITCEYIKK